MKISFIGDRKTQMPDVEAKQLMTGNRTQMSMKSEGHDRIAQTGAAAVRYSNTRDTSGSVWEKQDKKGKSLIELQQQAESIDVDNMQNYMTVMSNTMSQEDYSEMEREGFSFRNIKPEEASTILDKIKVELIKSGKKVVGFTDDISMEALTEALGSQAVAEAVAAGFAAADLPLNQDQIKALGNAWSVGKELVPLEEGTLEYLIDNGMDGRLWNLYLAQNSGSAASETAEASYYYRDTNGYLARGEQNMEIDDGMNLQLRNALERMGKEQDDTAMENAKWLLNRNLPVTRENLENLEKLQKIRLPISMEDFAVAMTDAVLEHCDFLQAGLGEHTSDFYHQAVEAERKYCDTAVELPEGSDVTARRQLEEIRLMMTAEVNLKLLKSGFSIDTAPMEELIEALKQAERQVAEQWFPKDTSEQAISNYRIWNRTQREVQEIPSLPVSAVQIMLTQNGDKSVTFDAFYQKGLQHRNQYEEAGERYETMMTQPRSDLGDSVKKAFSNINDILDELQMPKTEDNRRAVRILGYNGLRIDEANVNRINESYRQVQDVVQRMTPKATLEMIRSGINPLESTFDELEQFLNERDADYDAEAESYSRFLYRMEQDHSISQEERDSYIGIYRLLHQIEKNDSSVIGAVVQSGAELQFDNLLSAVRTRKLKGFDTSIGEGIQTIRKELTKDSDIALQIGRAYLSKTEVVLQQENVSAEDLEAETAYDRQQYRETMEILQARSGQQGAIELLAKGEIDAAQDNVIAATALLEDAEDLFRMVSGRKAGRRLHEAENLQEFRESYAEQIAEATKQVEQETFQEDSTSIDVRVHRLAYKQLGLMSRLTDSDEYFIPMYVGDRLARVHLTFQHAEEEAGCVNIRIRMSDENELQASFWMNEDTIEGNILALDGKGVMNPDQLADNFIKEAPKEWSIGTITVGSRTTVEQGSSKVTDDLLYRISRVFLRAVGQYTAE